MLTELKAYSSWRSAPTLSLSEGGRPETDLIQVRNITGLDPVKASVNTTPYGAVDGESYVGSSIPKRNIVLTLRPNPDWNDWSYEALRRLLYSYFMPKRETQLVFLSDDMIPVEISGIVEGVEVNMFSKDPELQVSIVCPDPYFTAVDPTVVTGQALRPDAPISAYTPIEYGGTIETGIQVKVFKVSGPDTSHVGVAIDEWPYLGVTTTVDATKYFEMSSMPMRKYVQTVELGTGIITNLLNAVSIEGGSDWPIFQPGENNFAVITTQGVQDWELTYFERFGGL